MPDYLLAIQISLILDSKSSMDTKNLSHPPSDILVEFTLVPDRDDFDSIRLHLAECVQCRQLVSGLQWSQNWLLSGMPGAVVSNGTLSEWEIADYVDGKLGQEELSRVGRVLDLSPSDLKAALHYSAHSAAMGGEVIDNSDARVEMLSGQVRVKSENAWLLHIKSWSTFKWPVWIGMPVTVAAVLVLVIQWFPHYISGAARGYPEIVSYQDDPVMIFSAAQKPGIGFFENAKQTSEAFKGMNVSRIDDGLFRLKWESVKGAVKYSVKIYVTIDGVRELVSEVTTTDPQANMTIPQLDRKRHYDWELSGSTADNRVFRAVGGVVVNAKS